jgi:hypothetical protein
MEYAARLTRFPSRKTFVAPFVALVVGAGVATGAYALIDNGDATTSSKVIVVEQPGPHAADIPGKNEAATAAAISQQPGGRTTYIPGKNEAATAAAISQQPDGRTTDIPGKNEAATAAAISQQPHGVELRGSKASSTGTSSSDRAQELPSDPHGPAIFLRNHP